MQAGRLRFRIDVEEPVETTNEVGEREKTWTKIKTIWGQIDPVRGDERFSLQQVKGAVDTKITVRANAADDINSTMRFVYRTRIFDIDANVDWQTRGIMREIYCKEAQ